MNVDRKEYLRNYQREWIKKRREAFFEGKCCAKCGSKDRLELDHIEPSNKEHHAIWSWSKKRQKAELEKCQVLCYECHKWKTAWEMAYFAPDEMKEVEELYEQLGSYRAVAARLGCNPHTVARVIERDGVYGQSPSLWSLVQ